MSTASVAAAQTTSTAADDALLNELARRDLTVLLEHEFEVLTTPPQQRDAIRASAALAKLTREGQSLPLAQRRQMVAQIVTGIAPVIPSLNDPRQLARQADALMAAGAASDVNVLEYWGASTVAQAQLRPVAQTVIQLLDRAIELADAQAAVAAENANPNDAAALRRIEAIELVGQIAQQSRAMALYQLALACEPSDAERGRAADAAIAFLEPLDAEGNPSRDAVRIALGKLYTLKRDWAKARAALDAAVASTAQPPSEPPAGVTAQAFAAQQRGRAFESRFFRAVVEVQAKDAKAARAQFDQLRAWERQTNATADASIATADRLLEYRILAIEPGHDAKQRASALLMQLLKDRPDLEGPIMTQLRANVAPDAPVASLEPLLLRSLVTDAQERVVRAQADPSVKPDAATLNRGLDAANELIKRQAAGTVDERTAAEAAFLVPVFLEPLDRKAEAAGVYLTFAEQHTAMPELARAALENAQRVFAQLGGLRSSDPAVTQLYDRILPLAIEPPFNQRELLYDWGLRLQQTDRPAEAIKVYERVERDDPRYADARYLTLVALAQEFEAMPADASGRGAAAQRIRVLADEVRAATASTSPTGRTRLARVALVAAEAARAGLNDPAQALKSLEGFEATVAGLPDEESLLGQAIFTRVQANAALGNTDRAVADLETLLTQSGGMRGAQIVYNLLAQLEHDFAAAEAADDRPRMSQIQVNRSILTARLVKWAGANLQDPALLYRYRVYDADTQRIAATLLDDPAARAAKQAEATQRFEALDSPEGRALFAKTRATSQPTPRFDYDPRVALGLARLAFDSGDWADARDRFARLLSDNAVGGAMAVTRDPASGAERTVDNDVYWECTLRLFQSRLRAGGDAGPVRDWLREQYARKGDGVGGERWREAFTQLRRELLPDSTPATAPAP